MKEGFYWFLSDNIADRVLYGRTQLYGMAPGWEMMEVYEAKGGLRVSGNRGGDNFNVPIAGLRGRYRGPVELPKKERTMKDETFWLVWCPEGATFPAHKHRSVEEAEREAERLARQNPKSRFYVLHAVAAFEKTDVVRIELEPPF